MHIPLKVQKEASAKLGPYLECLFADDSCISVQRVFQGTLKRSVTDQNSTVSLSCHKSEV